MTDERNREPMADERSGHANRRWWIEGVLIVAFWTCLFMLTAGQRIIDPPGPADLAPGLLIHSGVLYGLWLVITPGIFWLAHRYGLERSDWLRHLFLHVAAAVGVALFMNVLNHALLHTFVFQGRRPFFFRRRLFISMRFLDELIIYLVVLAAGFARNYFLRYRERQEEAARLRAQTAWLEAQLAAARLEALRMQVNPHFLFNTLHAIATLVDHDPRGVQRMIARLSELLRYALDNTSAQEVPLSEELKFLEDYLEIQRIRFQGRLETAVQAPPELRDALVPSLILQPIVENAIKHGVSQVDGVGRIHVQAHRSGSELVLTVRDNGPGLTAAPREEEAGTSGVGLRNTQERLQNLYGDAQHLQLRKDEGLLVEIVLPYHTSQDLHTTAVSSGH